MPESAGAALPPSLLPGLSRRPSRLRLLRHFYPSWFVPNQHTEKPIAPAPLPEGSLGALLGARAALHPQAFAIFAPERKPLSYAGLRQQAQYLSASLHALGVVPSTRVALLLPNGPEMATAFLGIAACAACVPLNPAMQATELRLHLQQTGCRTLVMLEDEAHPVRGVAMDLGLHVVGIEVDAGHAAGQFRLAPRSPRDATVLPVEPGPLDVALVLATSGTTARPKLVPLSHANLLASAHNIARHLDLTADDRCLNVMPLFHIHGIVGALLASLSRGAGIVCTPGFDAQFFDWIVEFEPTWYTAVPTIHQAVVAAGSHYRTKAPAHRFRFVRSSSSALPPSTFESLQALLDAPVVEAYGMTEASHQMASNPLPPGRRKAGSVGVPAGVEIVLLDEAGQPVAAGAKGEIAIRGPAVMSGYEDNVEANARAFASGWLRTGDEGRFDGEGYLFISGRLKEMVNRGGEKIAPREVDEVLLLHPGVLQAVAFPVPHATLGEDLAAAVVLREGASATEAELRGFAFERLAAFKVPSTIVFVSAMPMGATGKIQRTTLHERLSATMTVAFVAPRTDTERALAAVFREVLGVDAVGVDDNFFALGGDSLKGARVTARINAEHAIELAVPALFRRPTVATLAAELEDALSATSAWERELAAEIEGMSDAQVARLLSDP